ncbi:hypothetical protein GCM10007938_15010 [Vibrio zhanjiangensis]|uniref:ISL3 family transposase n=1 Tax=Vibrio zhanjiangensis TaxID=1046128 RepID=A0ABQ6EX27_9VIBR|nr:hypothetical protein GCM10007938_15010 [Vibrio zhanjiangensis]
MTDTENNPKLIDFFPVNAHSIAIKSMSKIKDIIGNPLYDFVIYDKNYCSICG